MADAAVVTEYTITGMTCQHCVNAVTEEVGALPEVTEVQVELATGRVSVTSNGPVDDAALRAVIEDAGYEVVDRG